MNNSINLLGIIQCYNCELESDSVPVSIDIEIPWDPDRGPHDCGVDNLRLKITPVKLPEGWEQSSGGGPFWTNNKYYCSACTKISTKQQQEQEAKRKKRGRKQ